MYWLADIGLSQIYQYELGLGDIQNLNHDTVLPKY